MIDREGGGQEPTNRHETGLWIGEQTEATDRQSDSLRDRLADMQTDEWTAKQTDRHRSVVYHIFPFCLICIRQSKGQNSKLSHLIICRTFFWW